MKTEPPTSPAAFLGIVEAILGSLPDEMQAAAERVAIRIQDFAEPEVLADFGMSDPHQLTGLYHGVATIHESVTFPTPDSPMIFLYRKPILAEWRARGDVALEDLVAHVFVHELAHHFGWSDEEIDALLDSG